MAAKPPIFASNNEIGEEGYPGGIAKIDHLEWNLGVREIKFRTKMFVTFTQPPHVRSTRAATERILKSNKT